MRLAPLRRAARLQGLLPLLIALAICLAIGAAIAAPAPLQVGQLVTVELAGQAHCMRIESIDAYTGTAWLVYAGPYPGWVHRAPLGTLRAGCA